MGLTSHTGELVKNLSGGQKQRVAIARAIVNEPEILILDEPTGSLNRDLSDEIMDYVYNYVSRNNRTMILVTHDLEKVKRGHGRIVEISNGQIISDIYG